MMYFWTVTASQGEPECEKNTRFPGSTAAVRGWGVRWSGRTSRRSEDREG